jgi:hypothetical protein
LFGKPAASLHLHATAGAPAVGFILTDGVALYALQNGLYKLGFKVDYHKCFFNRNYILIDPVLLKN